MRFFEKITFLKNSYSNEFRIKDNAFLYGIYTPPPPLAKHIVYMPMPYDVMENVVKNYKLQFPKELLELYKTMNGANLFWTYRLLGQKQIRIAYSQLSIYGVPLTCDRKHIEPYNISIEDLNRPAKTPAHWLKFGSYSKPENSDIRYDMYTDTKEHDVYSVKHDAPQLLISEKWKSIDECLCSVFDMLWDKGKGQGDGFA